ncbi:MAG: hypothetical protein DMG52_16265 [Acidobacteria bacterium]|nr:MAG: hypothetical protein DMG52_16265 [Acidobacteriota bacterium]
MDFFDLPPPPDELLPPDFEPEPDWKIYEGAIARIEESHKNCKVTRNNKVNGRRSGVERQVDVWLVAEIGDNHVVTVAIECRRYSDRPVSIKDIDAFVGFLEDVGANKGVMISHSGYTDGAKKRAEGAGIELCMLTVEQAEEFDWDEFLRDSCEASNECFGTINWHSSDGDSEAGRCGNCGSFHIRCGNCGWVSWYNEWDIESCSGCDMKWRLKKEKGETCGIEEMPPEQEPDDEEEE